MNVRTRYWFPAKLSAESRRIPATWEGWLALAAGLPLVLAAPWLFSPGERLFEMAAYIAVVVFLVFAVCYVKSEPPRWR